MNNLQPIFRLTALALALLFAAASASAVNILPRLKREVPNVEKLTKEVNDRSGVYYYPRLMKEYEQNDTLMKIDKYRRLYLGFMLQEDYDPYRPYVPKKDISDLLNLKRTLNKAECDTVIKYARQALDNNPFDLKNMTYLIQALRDKGDINLAKIWQYKLNYILMAIVSTGSGTDEEDAWWVTEPSHEYVLLNMMGFTVTGHEFVSPGYEVITVKDRYGHDAGPFYFNIITLLDEYYRKHPDEE